MRVHATTFFSELEAARLFGNAHQTAWEPWTLVIDTRASKRARQQQLDTNYLRHRSRAN